MTENGTDWRTLDGERTAWFEAPSHREGAVLGARMAALPPEVMVDLRSTGVRVRVDSDEHAEAVSSLARDLGLRADPSVLQQVSLVIESANVLPVRNFWQRALGYVPAGNGCLVDPLVRDPRLRIRLSNEARPLRSRIHVDVGRPAASVEPADLGPASGPFGVRHADPDGNEVDLVPGGPLEQGSGTEDWQVVFSAMACYRVTSDPQQRDLAAAAAAVGDDARFPLNIDVRPGLVIVSSGKDRWERDAHGLEADFADLAAQIQGTARSLGAVSDPELPRFTQLFVDAADVGAVKTFWCAALGYAADPRDGVDDIHDPRRLNPVLAFQELDPSETARRRQRNRIHVELAVPRDVMRSRLAEMIAAGGRLTDESDDRLRVADPEGNELVVVGGV